MENAIWLLMALPSWYLGAAAAPLSAGALTLVPAVGVLSLVVALILGAIQRRRQLFWFLLPFALSELLVIIAGLMRGQVRPMSEVLNVCLDAFLGLQLVLAGYLTYRLRGGRGSAAALGVFSVSYAAMAVFVAAMSFTDNWL